MSGTKGSKPGGAGGAGGAKHLSLSVAEFIETGTAAEPGTRAAAESARTPQQEEAGHLSRTRQRLLGEVRDHQMVLVRLLEDARWVQGRARSAWRETEKTGERLNLLKLFWAVRTELVKVLQGLGVLPRELFFEPEKESDFEHLSTEVAETISGLLSGRLEPNQTTDGNHAP